MIEATRTARPTYPLWTTSHGWAGQEVVRTEDFLPTIMQMLGDDFDPNGGDCTRTMEIIPEPDNETDRYAVSVRFDDKVVGYLPRADAIRYHRPLLEVVRIGYVPTVEARVWAGERTEYDDHGSPRRRTRTQLNLKLTSPETMLPQNDPPRAAYTLLPGGSAIQVRGTNDHFDVLRRYPGDGGASSLIVTLHAIEAVPVRTVEVRLDGHRIGNLSTTMSDAFLPTIDHFSGRGLRVAARAVLNASLIAANVTLSAPKAFEMSSADLLGDPATVPTRGVGPASETESLVPMEDSVQTGVTARGSTITVTEKPSMSLVAVAVDFVRPLTAWQQKIASKVFAKAAELLASRDLEAPTAYVVDAELHAYAPLDCAQEFLDALISIEESDFATAQEFCER